MKILVPTTIPTPEVPGHETVGIDAFAPIPPEHRDAEVLVLWGQKRELAVDQARSLPRLRLVQSCAAGAEPAMGLGLGPGVKVCTGVGLHGPTVAEHAVAMALALLRRTPLALTQMAEHRWDGVPFGRRWQLAHDTPRAVESLRDAHVVVWGFGDIGQTAARLFSAFGARVTGIARSAGTRAGFPVVDDVDAVLPDADVLVMVLPGGEATRHALDERRLGLLERGRTFLVNVGRGTAIDQRALENALRSGHLAGAALDVTDPEPLPSEATLWDAPNLIITPHTAGGRLTGLADLLAHQCAHLDDGGMRNVLEG